MQRDSTHLRAAQGPKYESIKDSDAWADDVFEEFGAWTDKREIVTSSRDLVVQKEEFRGRCIGGMEM